MSILDKKSLNRLNDLLSPPEKPKTIFSNKSVANTSLTIQTILPLKDVEPASYISETTTKICEKNPSLPYGSLLDEVYEDWGGISEVIECKWNTAMKAGITVCLMNDWRVIRVKVKDCDYINLTDAEKRIKMNHDAMVFEDMDNWSHWEETIGDSLERDLEEIRNRNEQNQIQEAKEQKAIILEEFFNGHLDSVSKLMSGE